MNPREERILILEMIETGKISSEEGLQLLADLDQPDAESIGDPEVIQSGPGPVPAHDPEDLARWKKWWVIPLWVGVAVTLLGAALMYGAYTTGGLTVWFFLSWLPFLLGVATIALAWRSQTSPWIHLRIQQAPGETPQRIAFSFPLPIRLTAWVLRTFGRWIPNLDAGSLDEVILALGESADHDQPLSIVVNEGQDGEQVLIYIG
jgi:hypothetical protein